MTMYPRDMNMYHFILSGTFYVPRSEEEDPPPAAKSGKGGSYGADEFFLR